MFSKPKRGGYKQRPPLFDFVNSKIIRKFVVSNCSSEVCMAKVGLENDTLKQPKCPSNWEYSTGQRQLLDIQSGEQMDRLPFSAPNQVSEKSETFLLHAVEVAVDATIDDGIECECVIRTRRLSIVSTNYFESASARISDSM